MSKPRETTAKIFFSQFDVYLAGNLLCVASVGCVARFLRIWVNFQQSGCFRNTEPWQSRDSPFSEWIFQKDLWPSRSNNRCRATCRVPHKFGRFVALYVDDTCFCAIYLEKCPQVSVKGAECNQSTSAIQCNAIDGRTFYGSVDTAAIQFVVSKQFFRGWVPALLFLRSAAENRKCQMSKSSHGATAFYCFRCAYVHRPALKFKLSLLFSSTYAPLAAMLCFFRVQAHGGTR